MDLGIKTMEGVRVEKRFQVSGVRIKIESAGTSYETTTV
jgi:hypothetical protein